MIGGGQVLNAGTDFTNEISFTPCAEAAYDFFVAEDDFIAVVRPHTPVVLIGIG